MGAAIHVVTVQRGIDPRDFALVAFGGAGPVHACGVAELLDSPQVVFPANASVLSAFGALVTPVRIDLARSYVRKLDQVSDDERDALLDEMRNEGRSVLSSAGVPLEDVVFRYAIDARYAGQGNEITVPLGEGESWPTDVDTVRELFAKHYEAVYGMTIPDVAVEVVTWRISAYAPAPQVSLAARTATGVAAPKGTRAVRFTRGDDPLTTPVFDREMLGVGARIIGPALLEERETTAVLRPGWTATVNEDGSVIAVREG
jgi:N-methylhydantoinase A